MLVLTKALPREPLPFRDAENQFKRAELPAHEYVRQIQLRERAELTRSLASALASESSASFEPDFYFPRVPVQLTAMPEKVTDDWFEVAVTLANAMSAHEVWLAGRQDLSSQDVAQALSNDGFQVYTQHVEAKLAALQFLAKRTGDAGAQRLWENQRKWLASFRTQRTIPLHTLSPAGESAPLFLLRQPTAV